MGDLMFNMHQYVSQEKRQEVISSVYNLGTIKGKGSSTRIFNNCLNSTNDNVDACLNLIASGVLAANLPVNGLLFDLNFIFNKAIVNDKPENLPNNVKYPLLRAISRWKKIINLDPNMVKFIREYDSDYEEWKGIIIDPIEIKNFGAVGFAAKAGPSKILLKGTTTITNCKIQINTFYYNSSFYPKESQLVSILAHELGHCLGMTYVIKSLTNGNGSELLPNVQKGVFFYTVKDNPDMLFNKYYLNTINSYNSYGGFKPPTIIPPPIDKINKYMPVDKGYFHLLNYGLDGLQQDVPTTNWMYYGFYNELMISTNNPNIEYYISDISKNILLQLYTIWKGKKINNYIPVGSSEVTKHDVDEDNSVIVFNKKKSKESFNIHLTEKNDIFIKCQECDFCTYKYPNPEDNFCQVIPPKRTFNNMFTSLK